MKKRNMRVLIFGAGSTGCFIGAQLSLAGFNTHLFGRERVFAEIRENEGIETSDHLDRTYLAERVTFHTEQDSLTEQQFDICFVTLKCHQLKAVESSLLKIQRSGCELHFLQNGIDAKSLLSGLDADKAYSGIIPFNVIFQGGGKFHQGTEGGLQLQTTSKSKLICKKLKQAEFECELFEDIAPVVNGKLLLNLNNAINAISNLPLKVELENAAYRRVLARAMEEYLALCAHQRKALVISAPLPPTWLPKLLKCPNWLFTRVAKKMLSIDPLARSSMWEDIQQGRKTEIEFLNGYVAANCKTVGLPYKTNAAVAELIEKLENGDKIDSEALFSLIG